MGTALVSRIDERSCTLRIRHVLLIYGFFNEWQPSATCDDLKTRAKKLKEIRTYFDTRGFLEVETPYLTQYGITDIYLANIRATFRNKNYYLQTSPEYHMKRLLASGHWAYLPIGTRFS